MALKMWIALGVIVGAILAWLAVTSILSADIATLIWVVWAVISGIVFMLAFGMDK